MSENLSGDSSTPWQKVGNWRGFSRVRERTKCHSRGSVRKTEIQKWMKVKGKNKTIKFRTNHVFMP